MDLICIVQRFEPQGRRFIVPVLLLLLLKIQHANLQFPFGDSPRARLHVVGMLRFMSLE